MNKRSNFEFRLHENGTIIFKGHIEGESFEVKVPKSEVLNHKTMYSFQGQYYPSNTERGGWFDMLTGKFPLSQEEVSECNYRYKFWSGERWREFNGCYIKKIEPSILAFFCITLNTEKSAQEIYEQAHFMKKWKYEVPYVIVYHKGKVYIYDTVIKEIKYLLQYKQEVDTLNSYLSWEYPFTDFKKTGETWGDYISYVGITSSGRSAWWSNSNMVYLLRNAINDARDHVITANGPKRSMGEKLEEEFYDALHTPIPEGLINAAAGSAIITRYENLLIINYKDNHYHISRFILDGTKHFSNFVKRGDNWYYEKHKVRDLYSYDLISWDPDVVKGTIYEPICRIKHFGDIKQQPGIMLHYFQYLNGKFGGDQAMVKQYIKEFTAFFDNDLLYSIYEIDPNCRPLISMFQTQISLYPIGDWIRGRLPHSRQKPFTNSYDWYGVNRHQISKFVPLLKVLKSQSRASYYQGLTYRSASSDLFNFIAKFWYNNETADLRGLSDQKFDLLFDWIYELKDYPWSYYSDNPIPANIDKESLIRFWQKEGYKPQDLRNWRDTIRMMHQVTRGEPLTSSVLKIRLADLHTIHDRLAAQIQEFESKPAAEKWEIQKPIWEKYVYEDPTYTIIVPEKPEDLTREGTLLQHCVGSYINSVANGNDIILFLRKKEKPDEPFYTLNLSPDGTKIEQVHGHHNKWPAMNPEILPFLDKWIKKFKIEGWEGIRDVKKDHY